MASELSSVFSDIERVTEDHSRWMVGADWPSAFEELYGLLEKVQALQAPFKLVDADKAFEWRGDRLMAWLRTHPSFKCADVKLVDNIPGRGRGVVATGRIEEGDPVVSVPLSTALSTDTALMSRDLGSIAMAPQLQLSNMPTVMLAVHLMVEHAKAHLAPAAGADATAIPVPADATPNQRTPEQVAFDAQHVKEAMAAARSGKKQIPLPSSRLDASAHPWGSRFRALIACLPENPGNALSWSPADMRRLRHTMMGQQAARFLRDAVKTYLVQMKVFGAGGANVELIAGFGAAWYTWAHFKWALAVVMSRQNNLPSLLSEDMCLALVPLYDMHNHAPGPITSSFSWADECCSMAAMRSFEPGQEVTMSYGHRPLRELVMYQGFVPEPERDAAAATAAAAAAAHDEDAAADADDEGPEDAILLEAALPAGDALAPIKTGMLARLGVHWRMHCSQHVPKLMYSTSPPTPVHALKEAECWTLPFNFPYSGGAVPAEALTFARVAALSKAEAAQALRTAQEALQTALAQHAAARSSHAEEEEEEEEECHDDHCDEGEEEEAGGHGHSHGASAHGHSHGGQPCGGHGHGGGHGHSHGGGHGHSHGGGHGHAHGGKAGGAGGGSHGHSHGGVPCGGHGHGAGEEDEELGPVALPTISAANDAAAVAALRSQVTALQAALSADVAEAEAAGTAPPLMRYLRSQLRLANEAMAALPAKTA